MRTTRLGNDAWAGGKCDASEIKGCEFTALCERCCIRAELERDKVLSPYSPCPALPRQST